MGAAVCTALTQNLFTKFNSNYNSIILSFWRDRPIRWDTAGHSSRPSSTATAATRPFAQPDHCRFAEQFALPLPFPHLSQSCHGKEPAGHQLSSVGCQSPVPSPKRESTYYYPRTHSTLYTLHSTLYTLHSTLYTNIHTHI